MRRRMWPVPSCRMACINRKQRIRKWPEFSFISAPFRIRNVSLLNKAVISSSLVLLICSCLQSAHRGERNTCRLWRIVPTFTRKHEANNKTSSRTNYTLLVPNHMHRYSHHLNLIPNHTTGPSFLTILYYKSSDLQSVLAPPFSICLRLCSW